ncbi:hypothetical protein [Streptomyces sp. NPDC102490]|uniref:hypothetical protein n=1 Tax=Streptomyces sp. NPDC102490 TaxID=3366183 RepID=UPI003830FACA
MSRVQRLARWLLNAAVDVDGIRLMIRQPKQWLLARAHHPWIGLAPLALIAAGTYVGRPTPFWLWTLAVVYGALSFGTDTVGNGAHSLWQRGRIWQDTICPCCDAPGDGGWWFEHPDLSPDGPEDHGRTPDETPRPSLTTITTPRERAAQAAYAATNLEGLR